MEVYPFHKHEVPYEHKELQLRMLVEMLGTANEQKGKAS
jgi:hypothetical protein